MSEPEQDRRVRGEDTGREVVTALRRLIEIVQTHSGENGLPDRYRTSTAGCQPCSWVASELDPSPLEPLAQQSN
jgi:hypothetical protein